MTPFSSPKPIVAAFDFDGTLTYHDTLIPFLFLVAGRFRTLMSIFLLLPFFIACGCGFYSRQKAKEKLLKNLIGGMPLSEIQQKGIAFVQGPLKKKLRPEGMNRLRWHQNQGHRCILVSATLNVYLQPWSIQEGFESLVCSKLQVDPNGKVTGLLDGDNCWGKVKVDRLIQQIGSRHQYILYAYGDSRGDKELLEAADYPFYRSFGSSTAGGSQQPNESL